LRFNGLVRKNAGGFGLLEYWRIGALEKDKPLIRFELVLSFHYSIAPQLHYSSISQHEKKTIAILSRGG
jgi:hypothetical protein